MAFAGRPGTLFQEIEGEGGLAESLFAGEIQGRIAAVRAKRERAVATRKEPITGTSEFPNIHEADVAILLPSPLLPAAQGESDGTVGRTAFPEATADAAPGQRGPITLPLPSLRIAEPFESLRDTADAYLRPHGRAAQGVSCQSRPDRRFHGPRHLRPELLRGGRH